MTGQRFNFQTTKIPPEQLMSIVKKNYIQAVPAARSANMRRNGLDKTRLRNQSISLKPRINKRIKTYAGMCPVDLMRSCSFTAIRYGVVA